jgi:hypothetical protein
MPSRVSPIIVGPDLDDADANGDVDTDCGRPFGRIAHRFGSYEY